MKSRIFSLSCLLLLVIGSVIALFPQKALAATVSGTWDDMMHITIGPQMYTDNKLDSDWNFSVSTNGCSDYIKNFVNGQDGRDVLINPTSATLFHVQTNPATSKCDITSTDTVNLSNVADSKDAFVWTDPNTLTDVTNPSYTFTNTTSGSPNVYLQAANVGNQCKSQLTVNGDPSQAQLLIRVTGDQDGTAAISGTPYGKQPMPFRLDGNSAKYVDGCTDLSVLNNNPVHLGYVANATAAPGQTTPTSVTASTTSTGSTAQSNLKCDIQWNNPLTWLICPMIAGAQDLMGVVGTQIQSYLTVPGTYFDTTCSSPGDQNCVGAEIHTAWSSMRDISLAGITVVALIMVLSQAFSFGPFDAYTVKKVLPRILVAAILITLSWPLVALAVGISNGIGEGIRTLILTPFKNMGGGTPNLLSLTTTAAAGVGLGLVLGIMGSLTFAITGALAVLTGLAIIILRQMVVILLAIFAPVAIVFYILPGDKIWKLWWDSFFGALLMFPLIEALIAAGAVFSRIMLVSASNPATQQSYGGATFEEIIAFLAAYIPYFVLPMTLRFAGGAVSAIGGVTHSASKGLHGRLSKYRANTAAHNANALKTGSRFQERGQFGIGGNKFNPVGRFNRISQGLGTGQKGNFGLGKKGKGAMDISTRAAAAEAMKDPKMNQAQFDDDAILALSLAAGSGSRAKAELTSMMNDGVLGSDWNAKRVDQAVATASSVGFSRANSTAAIDMMARNKNFSLPKGAAGTEAMIRATDSLAGVRRDGSGKVIAGNEAMANNLMGSFEFNSRQAGDFVHGMHDYEHGKADLDAAWKKATIQQHAQGTTSSLKAFADDSLINLDRGSAGEKESAAIRLLEMQNSLPYGTGSNQGVVNDTVQGARVSFEAKPETVSDGKGGTITKDMVLPVEEQLARRLRGTGLTITADQLRGSARVYDQNDPNYRSSMFGDSGGGAPTPPAGGTTP